MRIIITICILLGLVSCEKLVMKPNPETSNKAIFHEYAKLVREKYAMLDFKGVDIDFLTDSISNEIDETMTEEELFDATSIITARLRDGHSSLSAVVDNSDFLFVGFDLYLGYPKAFNDTILKNNYVGDAIAPRIKEHTYNGEKESDDVVVSYGFLPQSDEIGYVRIPSFNVDITDEELESIFQEIAPSTALIVDVRGNGGGDPSLSTKMASYFMDEETYTGYERFKTGPDPDDFSDSQSYVTPTDSEFKYLKPVVVLTDRGCYSATTTLAYNMNPLEQVTFMGQRTGGGSGSVAGGFLANGWSWALSTSEFIDHLGNHLDDGIDPDISVPFDDTDMTTDEIIEEALDFLQD